LIESIFIPWTMSTNFLGAVLSHHAAEHHGYCIAVVTSP
jgi:hypothetical protein